jgi:hypothetical protein
MSRREASQCWISTDPVAVRCLLLHRSSRDERVDPVPAGICGSPSGGVSRASSETPAGYGIAIAVSVVVSAMRAAESHGKSGPRSPANATPTSRPRPARCTGGPAVTYGRASSRGATRYPHFGATAIVELDRGIVAVAELQTAAARCDRRFQLLCPCVTRLPATSGCGGGETPCDRQLSG